MTTYLVIRHGSNSANQPMTQSRAICFVEADDEDDAKDIAAKKETVYNNQYLEAIPEDACDNDDWNSEVDAELPTYKRATEKLRPQEAMTV